jgi:hypothetical protein
MARTLTMRSAWPVALVLLLLATLAVCREPAFATTAVEEERPQSDGPARVEGDASQQKVVVEPQPWWPGDGQWSEWDAPGAPRISVWVDRGEWATYEPGDQIAVYFRVDRPCHVTILDYTTTGEVEVLFPSAWSGSGLVQPHEVYRIPDSRRYALRIAGPEGVETIVACAHEASWPAAPSAAWLFPDRLFRRTGPWRQQQWDDHGRGAVVVEPGRDHRGGRGAVVVDRGGPREPRRDRVIVEPRWWPVPPDWQDAPERWSCDEVNFYVAGGWFGQSESWRPGPVLLEQFEMWRCSDEFSRSIRAGDETADVAIRCIESEDGRPTEIVGRLASDDGWESETLFRIDVRGKRGDPPREGRTYSQRIGALRVEVEVLAVELSDRAQDRQRIEWIRFEVRAFAD